MTRPGDRAASDFTRYARAKEQNIERCAHGSRKIIGRKPASSCGDFAICISTRNQAAKS